jgi:hypothetical protein
MQSHIKILVTCRMETFNLLKDKQKKKNRHNTVFTSGVRLAYPKLKNAQALFWDIYSRSFSP